MVHQSSCGGEPATDLAVLATDRDPFAGYELAAVQLVVAKKLAATELAATGLALWAMELAL